MPGYMTCFLTLTVLSYGVSSAWQSVAPLVASILEFPFTGHAPDVTTICLM